ncbi:MAG: FAD-binding oxidoreductase [Geminicoccaceae bacterium]|nr:FAD-binding oxidoreductase [Geminicoccaceae bacterium]
MSAFDPPPVPASVLERCRAVLGPAGLVDDPQSIEPYVTDFWRQHRGRTPAVLRPSSTEEVAAVVRLAAEAGVPLVPQAGNTGLVRGGIPDESGRQVVLSLERMTRIREIDPRGEHIVVEAGCVLETVQQKAAAIGRLFPLALGAQGSCRIGGNLGTNAGGVNVVRYGMMRDLVLGLEVVLADGRVWDGLRTLRKDNTGYDLKQLFIGSEGTLGIVTAAALRLFPAPRDRRTCWLGIDGPAVALDVFELFRAETGEVISSFELLTGFGVEAACAHLPGVRRPLAEPHPWHLLIELAWTFEDGLAEKLDAVLERAIEMGLVRDGTRAESEAQRANMWRIREGQSEATRHMGFIVRSDVTVPIGRIPELVERMAAWVAANAPEVTLIPFGHLGDGNLHFNFVTPPERVDTLKPLLLERLYDEVTALGGSISAEHGIGRMKREALWRRRPPLEQELMRRIKKALDPQGILNPGVILAEPEEGL